MIPASVIWYKNKRVWRTLFSQFLTILTVIPAVLAIVNAQWPSELLPLVAAQALAVQAVVTKIMAIDAVNVWLAHFGLGSAPKAVLLNSAP